MFRRLLIIFSFIILMTAGFSARAYYNPGKPASFVSDYSGTLSAAQISSLENKLSQFNATTSNEIAVVIIKSLEGDTIENFAVKLFADWKIGKDKKDNGVLLLVAMEDRKMRIETGYGLEGALPDATAYQIITNTLTRAFKEGDYYGGIDKATDKIIAATQGEYTADASPTSSSGFNFGRMSFDAIFFIIIALFSLISWLWRFLAKSKSWWQGGVIGAGIGVVIALIFFSSLVLIILPIALGLFGLLLDFLVSRILPQPGPIKHSRNNLWFFGGGSGFGGGNGFGGSGGGFGGFGGGGSGGGGSSGGW